MCTRIVWLATPSALRGGVESSLGASVFKCFGVSTIVVKPLHAQVIDIDQSNYSI